MGKQGLIVSAVEGREGNADTGRHRHLLAALGIAFSQEIPQLAALFLHNVQRYDVLHQYHELIAADMPQDIRRPKHLLEIQRYIQNNRIADQMPQLVIDLLEIVHVNDEQGVLRREVSNGSLHQAGRMGLAHVNTPFGAPSACLFAPQPTFSCPKGPRTVILFYPFANCDTK